MSVELRAIALAGVILCAGLSGGCGMSGDQAQADQAQAVAGSAQRSAAARQIAERLAAFAAWQEEMAVPAGKEAASAETRAQLEARKPHFDDLKASALAVIAESAADPAALQAIEVVVRANPLEYDPALGGYPSEGEAAQLEAQMAQLLVRHHVNNPQILALPLKLDRLTQLDYWQQVFEASQNREVRANFAALLATYYFEQLDKPKLQREQRAALREQGMRFADLIRSDYPEVLPSALVPVPQYLLPQTDAPGQPGSGAPTLAQVMDDRIRLLEHTVGATLPNLRARTVTGAPDELEKYRGKVVVLEVRSAECTRCLEALPTLAQLKVELKNQPFEIIGVSLDENRAALQAFLRQEKLGWVQWHAGKGDDLLKTLGIVGAPTYLIVDARGVLRERTHHLGEASRAMIRSLVEKAALI